LIHERHGHAPRGRGGGRGVRRRDAGRTREGARGWKRIVAVWR
jgi:hypothetical protein